MIILILYTILLLFIDKKSVTIQCLTALRQWYESMIPTLFPMMLMSSIVVDTGFARLIGRQSKYTIFRILKLSESGCYCLISGFLFGFPMGAKTTSDMLQKQQLSKKEAEFLLSFINCIGPMYVVHFVHMLFPDHALWKLILCIYILPLCYGLVLRYTIYKNVCFADRKDTIEQEKNLTFIDALYECVPKCCKSILMLGGYMVLFQISFVTIKHLLQSINMATVFAYPLLEITGGLYVLPKKLPFCLLIGYLTLGGGCCMLQTYSFLRPANLSMKKYVLHKLILSSIAVLIGNFL